MLSLSELRITKDESRLAPEGSQSPSLSHGQSFIAVFHRVTPPGSWPTDTAPPVGVGDSAQCFQPELRLFSELISEAAELTVTFGFFIVLSFILVIFLSAIPGCYTGNKYFCLFLLSYWLSFKRVLVSAGWRPLTAVLLPQPAETWDYCRPVPPAALSELLALYRVCTSIFSF